MLGFLKKLIIPIITLGVVGFSLNLVFGANTIAYLTPINVNGVIMYKYDIYSYINNIKYQFDDISKLVIDFPNLNWTPQSNPIDTVILIIANIARIMLTGVNILIYPLRVAFYIIGVILAIIGLQMNIYESTQNPLFWLIYLIKTIIQFQIPMF